MRRLKIFKLWAVVALLVGGMSSCIDSDDSSEGMYLQYAYMLQNDNGTYTPQMRLLGYDLESAYLTANGQRFTFKALNEYMMELPESGMYAGSLDTVTFGYYTVTAKKTNGDTKNLSVGFYESSKKIGDIHLNQLEYDSETKKVHVSLKTPVQNAGYYYLMIKMPVVTAGGMSTGETMWIPYSPLELTELNNLSATVSLENLSEGTCHFALGVAYQTTFRISESIIVEIKKESDKDKDPEIGE